MIVEVKDNELLKRVTKYASRLNEIEKHNCKSSPVEYDQMLKYFERVINSDNNLLLAYIRNDEILGVVALWIEPENSYLQTMGGFFVEFNYQEIAGEFFTFIKDNYTGYEFYASYSSENSEAIKFMESVGSECVDDSIIYEINLNNYQSLNTVYEIVDLSEEYFAEFKLLHSNNFPDMYWNSRRLLNALDKFDIKIKVTDGSIVGYAITRLSNSEIYATYSKDNDFDVLYSLIVSLLNTMKSIGKDEVLIFSERTDELEVKVLDKCGFKRTGTSVTYHIDKI